MGELPVPRTTYDVCELGLITEHNVQWIGCATCDRPAAVGDEGWVWASFRMRPGFLFAAGAGSDRFYCLECRSGVSSALAQRDASIVSVGAEMAVAKGLGLDPAGRRFDSSSAIRIGDIQIRHMAWRNGPLIVLSHDQDHHRFVLVLGQPPQFTVGGWMLGRDAKRTEWLIA